MDNKRAGEQTLTIQGQPIKLQYGMLFWKLLEEKGIKMDELHIHLSGDEGPMQVFDTLCKVIVSAGWTAAKKDKLTFDYDEDDVIGWFEEDLDEKDIEAITTAMLSSKILGKSISHGLQRPGKKKPSSKK